MKTHPRQDSDDSFDDSAKGYLTVFSKGFLMGVADIIPGVSGGTVAFITGIYNKLLDSLSSLHSILFKRLLTLRIKEIFGDERMRFLTALGLGILSALLASSNLIHYLLNNHPVPLWSFFFGLILSSVVFFLRSHSRRSASYALFLLLGAALSYVMVGAIPLTTPDNPLFLFISGAVAICAMILPGISGAFILVILGKYHFVINLLRNPFVPLNLFNIAVFCAGCLTGLILFSQFLKFALRRFETAAIAFLTGFLAGSLRKIWPFKLEAAQAASPDSFFPSSFVNIAPPSFSDLALFIFFAALAMALFLGVERLAKKPS